MPPAAIRALSACALLLLACGAPGEPTGPSSARGGPGHGGGSASTYSVIDLGALTGTGSRAEGVNLGGDVVGYSTVSGAFLKRGDGSAAQDLGSAAGYPFDQAWDINASRTVVGTSWNNAGGSRGFVWTAASGMQLLSTLGGCCSDAQSVNDAGTIAGYAQTATGETHAVIWVNGAIQDIAPAGVTSYAWAIDASGRVVGQAGPAGNERGFRWDATGGFALLSGSGVALGIGGAGVAVGQGVSLPVFWAATTLTALPVLAIGGAATAVTATGTIVGWSATGTRACGSPASTAVFWPTSGGVTNLGVPNGIVYAAAWDVNDGGVAVGSSTDCKGTQRAVRWTLP